MLLTAINNKKKQLPTLSEQAPSIEPWQSNGRWTKKLLDEERRIPLSFNMWSSFLSFFFTILNHQIATSSPLRSFTCGTKTKTKQGNEGEFVLTERNRQKNEKKGLTNIETKKKPLCTHNAHFFFVDWFAFHGLFFAVFGFSESLVQFVAFFNCCFRFVPHLWYVGKGKESKRVPNSTAFVPFFRVVRLDWFSWMG